MSKSITVGPEDIKLETTLNLEGSFVTMTLKGQPIYFDGFGTAQIPTLDYLISELQRARGSIPIS